MLLTTVFIKFSVLNISVTVKLLAEKVVQLSQYKFAATI